MKFESVLFVILSLFVILWGCVSTSKELPPEELFVIHPKEQLTLDQQGVRLKYGRLLQPMVSGDSLYIPNTERVPLSYREYAENFAKLLNRYLREMDESDRQLVLRTVEKDVVENAVIGSYIRVKNEKYELELSRSEALKIGIMEKKYDMVVADVERVNLLFEQGIDMDVPKLNMNAFESVFFNSNVLTMVKKAGIRAAFVKDLEQLKMED